MVGKCLLVIYRGTVAAVVSKDGSRRDGAGVPIQLASVPAIQRWVVLEIPLFDTRNAQTAFDDMCVHLLSAVFAQSRLIAPDLAFVHVTEEGHHLGMEHGRKQLCVERRVTETLFKTVSRVVHTGSMYLGFTQLGLRGNVVHKIVVERLVQPDLEGNDEQDRWDGRYPQEGPEFVLKTNS